MDAPLKTTVSIVGAGAFGRFIVPYLSAQFDVGIYDPYQDLNGIPCHHFESLKDAAASDVILLAVPVNAMEKVCADLQKFVREGQTIIELASVKMIPQHILLKAFADKEDMNLLGVHALFGPESGKNGIDGLNVTITNIQGRKFDDVYQFLSDLRLNITVCSAEEHDEQMAYVQGLTHLLAKTFNCMEIPKIFLPTKTYELLDQMWKTIRHDSEDLFDLIQSQNPYAKDVRQKFIETTQKIDNRYRD